MLSSYVTKLSRNRFSRFFPLGFLFFFTIALALFTIPGNVYSAQVTLIWDANQPNPAGYRVYKTLTPGQYTFVKNDPHQNEMVWEGTDATTTIAVEEGECWFVATAFDSSGNESDPSNEVHYLTDAYCEGDFDYDGDVDSSDLAIFAIDFGRTDCAGSCYGDFDADEDVDGTDLAVFAEDFGRTDCP